MLKSNHNRLVALSAFLFVASVTMLFGLEACGQQESELKIVDLQGDTIIRIDHNGSVFDGDKKVAAVNDREGTVTFVKPIGDTHKIVFKNDPAVQRDNDRYIIKFNGDQIFEVKPDGSVSFNGQPWARVFGYTQNQAQKDRFTAAIVIIPFLESDPIVSLPLNAKNAEPDSAIQRRRQPKIWIPSNDKIYINDDLIQEADFNSKLGEKISEFLKRPTGANGIVYIASSVSVDWGTVVNVINRMRERGVDRIGLIVESNDHAKNRFLLQIPAPRDPDEDFSKLKPDPLLLGVAIGADRQIKLITGGLEGFHLELPYPQVARQEPKGTLNDPSSLSQTLARIFQDRRQAHLYKPGMETRTDLREDERVEKTVMIKVPRHLFYGDVIKIIDVVKGAGANPIVLQLDDLP